MRYYIFAFIILIISCTQKSENQKELLIDTSGLIYDTIENKSYFAISEVMPEFRNGEEGFFEFLTENIEYPKTAIEDSLQGKTHIGFVVEQDGSVSNVKALRGLRYDIDEECIRVISSSPKWTPGTQLGKPIRVYYSYPITFSFNYDTIYSRGVVIIPRKKIKENNSFKIFPNPATNCINIETAESFENANYQIINLGGQIMKNGQILSNTETIDISDLKNGTYVVRITSGEGNYFWTGKFVKHE